MEQQLKHTYSEVYSLLQMLGDNFINPIYSFDLKLEEQKIKKESLSMIALFHLTFWCESVEEREELNELFKRVEEERQQNKVTNNIF